MSASGPSGPLVQDSETETQFLLLSLPRESKYWNKNCLIKQAVLKTMAQIL